MTTFDIALKHLDGIDFSKFPIVITGNENYMMDEKLNEKVMSAKNKFDSDKDNTKSNDHYRSVVFGTAILHLIFKAHGWVSFFDVACEISEANKSVVNTEFEKYKGTQYPKVMVDQWNEYCENLKEKTHILEGELRSEFFMTAYHYTIEPQDS